MTFSDFFGRPRLAAASARTGAGDADAAGVAAPGDTKVSDAMGYQGGNNDARVANKKRKDKFCWKKCWHFVRRVGKSYLLVKMCFWFFFFGFIVVNVFEEKLSWRLLFENS